MRMNRQLSLDAPRLEDEDGEVTLHDQLRADIDSPEDIAIMNSLPRADLLQLLDKSSLTNRQKADLKARFLDGEFQTLDAISDARGVTRAAVSAIVIAALKKFKRYLRQRGYKEEDF